MFGDKVARHFVRDRAEGTEPRVAEQPFERRLLAPPPLPSTRIERSVARTAVSLAGELVRITKAEVKPLQSISNWRKGFHYLPCDGSGEC